MKSVTDWASATFRNCHSTLTARRSSADESSSCLIGLRNAPVRVKPKAAMITEVLKTIRGHQRFVLTSHARPDGDAVGSLLAAGQMLRSIGKDVEVVLSDAVPVIYKPLPFAETVVQT